jgi:hypothetical protein
MFAPTHATAAFRDRMNSETKRSTNHGPNPKRERGAVITEFVNMMARMNRPSLALWVRMSACATLQAELTPPPRATART